MLAVSRGRRQMSALRPVPTNPRPVLKPTSATAEDRSTTREHDASYPEQCHHAAIQTGKQALTAANAVGVSG